MSEELQQEQIDTQVVENTNEQTTEQEPQLTQWEIKAIEQGWQPKEKWDGNPDDWRPAKEFVERGELFSKISSQGGELKELRKALNYLVEHHQKVKETEFNRALTQLKQMKKEALVDGDPDKVVEVDEAIQTLREEQKANAAANAKPVSKEPTPLFVDFVKRNSWYVSDNEMRSFADTAGVTYVKNNPHASESDTYNYVEKQIKKAYPEKFQTKPNVPSVEGASTTSQSKNKTSKEYPLTEDERKTMMTFVRSGVMSKEDYIKELKAIKGEA